MTDECRHHWILHQPDPIIGCACGRCDSIAVAGECMLCGAMRTWPRLPNKSRAPVVEASEAIGIWLPALGGTSNG